MENNQVLYQTIQDYLKKKTKDFKVAYGMLLGLCGLVVLLVIFVPDNGESKEKLFRYGFLIVALLAALALIVYAQRELKKYNPETCDLLESIQNGNKNKLVAWVYPHHTINTQYGKTIGESHALVFKTCDNREFFIPLPNKDHVRIIQLLQVALPNISYGFSEELRNLYIKDPKALIK
jgi:hypothetical protein